MARTADSEWRALLNAEAIPECQENFALLVTRHSRLVFRIAYAVLRNVEDAEDVTQEAFFKLFRSGAWKKMEDEKAFLATMVWRLAVSKQSSRRPVIEIEPRGIPSGDQGPERAAMTNERSRTIHRLIDSLPDRLKKPLILSSLEEMNTREIAAAMEMPEGTIRRLISEARALIKEKMARLGGNQHE